MEFMCVRRVKLINQLVRLVIVLVMCGNFFHTPREAGLTCDLAQARALCHFATGCRIGLVGRPRDELLEEAEARRPPNEDRCRSQRLDYNTNHDELRRLAPLRASPSSSS